MAGLVNVRQFGTNAYNLGRLPVQTNNVDFKFRTPDTPEDTPTEKPAEEPSKQTASKGASDSKANTRVSSKVNEMPVSQSASQSAKQQTKSPGFLQQLGHIGWDAFNPNSGFQKDVSEVFQFGNPIPDQGGILHPSHGGGGSAAPVNATQFGKSSGSSNSVGSSTVKSAIGQPQEGFWGEAAQIGEDVGSALLDAL